MGTKVVAVTGATGYLGRRVVQVLEPRYQVVRLTTRPETAREHGVWGRVLDLASCSAVQAQDALVYEGRPVDALVHLGAFANVPASFETPGLCEAVNVGGTAALAEACARVGVGHVVFGSTIAVHGAEVTGPIARETALDPQSPYARSKVAAEDLLRSAAGGGLRVSVLRLSNLAGKYPGASGGGGVVAHLAREVLAGNALSVGSGYGTVDGTAERDFLDVRDAADLVGCALEHPPAPGVFGVYPAGSGRSVSVGEIARQLMGISGVSVPVLPVPRRPFDPDRVCVDISVCRPELGWGPQHALVDTLRSELEFCAGVSR